jgi:hypothetical protein
MEHLRGVGRLNDLRLLIVTLKVVRVIVVTLAIKSASLIRASVIISGGHRMNGMLILCG